MSKAKKKAPAPKDVAINRIQFPDEKGGLSLTATHPGFAALSAECVRLFKESKGVNYVEWTMQSGDPEFGIFDVIMQRKTGVTPAQKAAALAVENRRLWHALEELTVRDDKGRWYVSVKEGARIDPIVGDLMEERLAKKEDPK